MLECWSVGVLECWSVGVLECWFRTYEKILTLSLPPLRHFFTPPLFKKQRLEKVVVFRYKKTHGREGVVQRKQ